LRRGDVDATCAWPEDGRVLVVLLEPRRLGGCLEHLSELADAGTREVVVAMPEEQPLWWALALSSGVAPAGVDREDIMLPQRQAIALALGRHPEWDGLAVELLAPAWPRSIAERLAGGAFTKVVVVAERTSLPVRLLRRYLSRLCPATVAALPAGV
jgi:hypothetical protein